MLEIPNSNLGCLLLLFVVVVVVCLLLLLLFVCLLLFVVIFVCLFVFQGEARKFQIQFIFPLDPTCGTLNTCLVLTHPILCSKMTPGFVSRTSKHSAYFS